MTITTLDYTTAIRTIDRFTEASEQIPLRDVLEVLSAAGWREEDAIRTLFGGESIRHRRYIYHLPTQEAAL